MNAHRSIVIVWQIAVASLFCNTLGSVECSFSHLAGHYRGSGGGGGGGFGGGTIIIIEDAKGCGILLT